MEASTHKVVLNKWCKCILGVKDSTANAAVAGELGQFPLMIFRNLNMIKYWYKIVTGPKTRLRYKCYAHLKSFANTHCLVIIKTGQPKLEIYWLTRDVRICILKLLTNSWQRPLLVSLWILRKPVVVYICE